MSRQNLDRLCAQYGWQMAEKVHAELKKNAETFITKSLGILQENGVYAFFLYLDSQVKEDSEQKKTSSKAARVLAEVAAALLAHNPPALLTPGDHRQAMEQICREGGLADNLDNLLLAKRLLEQTLIYARYHAKALEG